MNLSRTDCDANSAELTDARRPSFSDAAEDAPEAPVSRPEGGAGAISLEACFAPPTGPQGAVIGDALRLLAAWAVRAAREAQDGGPEVPDTAETGLDFRRPGSDECVAVPSHDEE